VLSLICFALNSILCRLALKDGSVDPYTFSAVRALSASFILAAILLLKSYGFPKLQGGGNAIALFIYLIGFSLAYQALPAGTGALILFGAVQTTMMLGSIFRGEVFSRQKVMGVFLSVAGTSMSCTARPWRPAPHVCQLDGDGRCRVGNLFAAWQGF